MNSSYLILLLIYFSGRLFFSRIDNIINNGSVNWKEVTGRAVFGITLILLCDDIGKFIILFTFHALMITADCIKKPQKLSLGYSYLIKIVICAVVLAAAAAIIAEKISLIQNPLLLPINFNSSFVMKIFVVLTGYITVLKEGTIIIRLVLNRIKAEPQKADAPMQKDEEEYDRGKLIGILERTFVYFLILLGQIGAIAVIIALKSLARFKELDNKDFAEYFLIGSLLSLLTAAVPAAAVNYLLNSF